MMVTLIAVIGGIILIVFIMLMVATTIKTRKQKVEDVVTVTWRRVLLLSNHSCLPQRVDHDLPPSYRTFAFEKSLEGTNKMQQFVSLLFMFFGPPQHTFATLTPLLTPTGTHTLSTRWYNGYCYTVDHYDTSFG